MKSILRYIPKHILFLFLVYCSGIIVFTFFRLTLLLSESSYISSLPNAFRLLSQAFFIGWRFDTVISGYFLIVPLLLLSVTSSIGWESKWFYQSIIVFIDTIYLIGFLICSVDLPFFNYYFSHVTVVIFNWTNNAGFILTMIFEEPRYFLYLIAFILSAGGFIYLIRLYQRRFINRLALRFTESPRNYTTINITISIIILVVTLIGIRGRIAEKSPIRTGTAFFSNYAFPNQLGLNPVFTFFHSLLEQQRPENATLHLMVDAKAIDQAKIFFRIDSTSKYRSPIARAILPAEPMDRANIILVMMESMSASEMSHFGNPNNITPVLDSIANNGYCFDNIYTAGIHTFNGEYGTLFAYPALLKQHPMNLTTVPEYAGFSNILTDYGYRTIYFTTHDDQFDNVGGFFHANKFERVVSLEDYPSEKVLSTLGVPDDFMFEYSIPILTTLTAQGQPFFAAYMTASNHGPYIIPPGIPFKPHSADGRNQIIEYSDWSIGKLITLASTQPWFTNTYFVFVADHGNVGERNVYDMPLAYHHTPFIIYAPHILPHARHVEHMGGQIDIFPTMMGLVNVRYVNNTFGIDLLKETRPYIYFSADDKIGCLDHDFFFIYRENGIESLYKYRNSDVTNYLRTNSVQADSMRTYAFTMMQTAQWIITNKLTGKETLP